MTSVKRMISQHRVSSPPGVARHSIAAFYHLDYDTPGAFVHINEDSSMENRDSSLEKMMIWGGDCQSPVCPPGAI